MIYSLLRKTNILTTLRVGDHVHDDKNIEYIVELIGLNKVNLVAIKDEQKHEFIGEAKSNIPSENIVRKNEV